MADASATSAPAAATRHFLTFRLNDRHYAMPAEDVAEVIRVPAVARMPQSPAALMGLANLRGAVLPVASGRSLLGQGDAALSASARAIVMNGAAPVALAVDAVTELVECAVADIETRPAELAALPGEMLQGAFQSEKGGKVIKLLDIKTLLSKAFVARARVQRSSRQQTLPGGFLQADQDQRAQAKMVAFAVAGQEYALPLENVQEIITAPDLLASVPHSDAVVMGVASLRDFLLPLLSLRALLGFPRNREGTEKEKIVITSAHGHSVGLVVDGMRAIFSAEESRTDPIPDILAARIGGESRIKAIYRGAHGLVSILSPEQLFGDAVMKKLAAAQSQTDGERSAEQASMETRQFLVFRLGDEEYGLPIEAVEEVARVPDAIAKVPNTPKFLEGVVNLRGEVLPVVDQRKRFNMAKSDAGASRRLVVVRTHKHLAGLIVDSVSEVLRVAVDAIDVAPDLTGEATRLVQGVANLEAQNRIVLLLDPAELLTRAERGLLDIFGKQQSAPER